MYTSAHSLAKQRSSTLGSSVQGRPRYKQRPLDTTLCQTNQESLVVFEDQEANAVWPANSRCIGSSKKIFSKLRRPRNFADTRGRVPDRAPVVCIPRTDFDHVVRSCLELCGCRWTVRINLHNTADGSWILRESLIYVAKHSSGK